MNSATSESCANCGHAAHDHHPSNGCYFGTYKNPCACSAFECIEDHDATGNPCPRTNEATPDVDNFACAGSLGLTREQVMEQYGVTEEQVEDYMRQFQKDRPSDAKVKPCRACSECEGDHHWLPIEIVARECKHCDAIIRVCEECDGEGVHHVLGTGGDDEDEEEREQACEECDGHGVIAHEQTTVAHSNEPVSAEAPKYDGEQRCVHYDEPPHTCAHTHMANLDFECAGCLWRLHTGHFDDLLRERLDWARRSLLDSLPSVDDERRAQEWADKIWDDPRDEKSKVLALITDVRADERRRRERATNVVDELTAEAQRLGMYDPTPEERELARQIGAHKNCLLHGTYDFFAKRCPRCPGGKP